MRLCICEAGCMLSTNVAFYGEMQVARSNLMTVRSNSTCSCVTAGSKLRSVSDFQMRWNKRLLDDEAGSHEGSLLITTLRFCR
jgi:hypothetical protein